MVDDDDDHDDWCRIPQVMSENESMRVDDSRCDEAYVTVSSILATSYWTMLSSRIETHFC